MLKANPATLVLARLFHVEVFKRYGPFCYLHRLKNKWCRIPAVHAAHVIKRSRMGAAIAYGPKGMVDPRFGRPLCATCHAKQELGIYPEYRFPDKDIRACLRIHNQYAKASIGVHNEQAEVNEQNARGQLYSTLPR